MQKEVNPSQSRKCPFFKSGGYVRESNVYLALGFEMTKRSAPSAHDVARLAGVSQAAVSRAFTPGASIAAATREKVFQSAELLGYRPNLLARSLIKGESGIVGVVIGSTLNMFFGAALDLLSRHLSKAGKHILVFTASEAIGGDAQVEELLKYRVDALLMMAVGMSSAMAARCHAEKIPVVYFYRPPRDIENVATVVSNNRDGAKQIAEHLLQQGYKKIALLRGPEESPTSRERESGFAAHLSKRKVALHAAEIGYFSRDGAAQAARKLLSQKRRPDAIFCTSDYMAFAAIEVARYEFGLTIGKDIGIAGFDDVEQASWRSFDLTTFASPIEAKMRKVLEILLADQNYPTPKLTVVDGVIKPRGSTIRT